MHQEHEVARLVGFASSEAQDLGSNPNSPKHFWLFAGLGSGCWQLAVFSFLYFLKIKISKIYVRFEIFQKYTPVALP